MLSLQPDAVGVALLQMGDEHLAGELILAPGRDLEMNLEEGVGIAVEHRRHAVLVHEVYVLEPVDVLARSGGDQIDVLHQRPAELGGEGTPRQLLRVDPDLGAEPPGPGYMLSAIGRRAGNLVSHFALPRCPGGSSPPPPD